MRKIIFLAVFCLIISAISFAQVPQKMSYQAVVRGSDNNLVTNQQVAMRVSILQGSAGGSAVYTETHSAQTNANGLVSIEIGDGTSNDDFSAINWANGPFFVKTETDVNGGENYEIVGVSQLLSVPYAMYAQSAGNVPDVSGFLTEETDPTVSDWAKAETKPQYDYSEIQNTPEIPEMQVLSISNDTIFLSDGGFVKLPSATVDFSGDYNDLTNRPEIPTVPTNVSAFENDANYVINETDPTVPAWAKAETKPVYNYSEIEGSPEIPTVPTNVSAFENDANYVVNEADPTVPTWAKAETKPTYNYSEIEGTPEIPTVPTNVSAFENDANYVVNEADPTVSAWAKAETKPTYNYSEIEGTPEIPTVVSAFDNDANYLTTESQTLADAAALGNAINSQIKNLTDPTENQDAATKKYVDELIAQLQAAIDALNGMVEQNGNIPASYTITFDANGGTGTMEPQTLAPGLTLTVPENNTFVNYTGTGNFIASFNGWNTSADGTGATYYPGQVIVLWSDITLYAQWGYTGSFTDTRDGNTYATVTIGNQTWMAENLRYTGNTTLGTNRFYPNGNSSNVATYGYLYYFTAATNHVYSYSNPSNVQGICPNGWHLPSRAEWLELTDLLSSQIGYPCDGITDNIAKSLASTSGWNSSSTTCAVGNTYSNNNTSGFNAMPAGDYFDNSYRNFGNLATFWTASGYDGGLTVEGYYHSLSYNNTNVTNNHAQTNIGRSVRCVKDN